PGSDPHLAAWAAHQTEAPKGYQQADREEYPGEPGEHLVIGLLEGGISFENANLQDYGYSNRPGGCLHQACVCGKSGGGVRAGGGRGGAMDARCGAGNESFGDRLSGSAGGWI